MSHSLLAVLLVLSANPATAPAAASIPPAAASATPTGSPAPAATPSLNEPRKHEILQILFRNSSAKLSDLRYCGYAVPGVPSPTLGDWLGKLFADMESGDNTVESECDPPRDPSAAAASWTCHVDLVHADGDDHWKWGFEMRVRADDHTLVKSSLACSGDQ